jgi:hypothetical protein
MGDITDTVPDQALELRETEDAKSEQQQQPVGSSSTSSLLSLMWKKSAKNALARATGQQTIEASAKNAFIPPSMDATLVSQRIHHATAAVLAEDQSLASSKFTLSAEVMNQNEDFAVALQLLQNDVVTLCIRAGQPKPSCSTCLP